MTALTTTSMAGELHFFNYTFDAAPYITYGVLGPDGDLVKTVPIGCAGTTTSHCCLDAQYQRFHTDTHMD
jgi:carotenoid cleavage dioxygenase-like enzyme